MVLNASKCEVAFLSKKIHEANWQPTIIANNTRLLHNPQPAFLGVTLVGNLRSAHPEHLEKRGCQMPSSRLPHLEGVGVEEGPADRTPQSSYVQPSNLRGSGMVIVGCPFPHQAVRALPNKALRVVTGQLKSTPVETLR